MSFDWVHLHLMLNHLPVVLALLGAGAGVAALFFKREGIWRYAAATLLLAGLLAPLALWTGREAEDAAKKAWYVTRGTIHEHEEAAETATWLTGGTGVLALVVLLRKGKAWRVALAVAALAAAGSMAYAGLEGGKIVHDSPRLEQGKAGP